MQKGKENGKDVLGQISNYMTGPYQTAAIIFKRNRIEKLTKEGLSTNVIAERMGLSGGVVYQLQVKWGFRTPIPKKKKG